jgi:hypothetical protein
LLQILFFLCFSGLSQRDLALSKRAEEQLEQERRDQELAKRLQEELNMEQEPESEDARYKSTFAIEIISSLISSFKKIMISFLVEPLIAFYSSV